MKVNDSVLQQIPMENQEKSLGVIIGLSLQLMKQFTIIKDKMEKAMHKLRSILIAASNAYLFQIACLIVQVCFGCGIVKLSLQ